MDAMPEPGGLRLAARFRRLCEVAPWAPPVAVLAAFALVVLLFNTELHADDDKTKRELADARNEAENKIFQLEKLFKDSADKITEADKAPIQRAIDKVKEAVKANDLAAIKSATAELDPCRRSGPHATRRAGRPAPASSAPPRCEVRSDSSSLSNEDQCAEDENREPDPPCCRKGAASCLVLTRI